jgi:hypothetical protein
MTKPQQAPDLTLLELLEEIEACFNYLRNQRYRNKQGVMRNTYDLVKQVEAHAYFRRGQEGY